MGRGQSSQWIQSSCNPRRLRNQDRQLVCNSLDKHAQTKAPLRLRPDTDPGENCGKTDSLKPAGCRLTVMWCPHCRYTTLPCYWGKSPRARRLTPACFREATQKHLGEASVWGQEWETRGLLTTGRVSGQGLGGSVMFSRTHQYFI